MQENSWIPHTLLRSCESMDWNRLSFIREIRNHDYAFARSAAVDACRNGTRSSKAEEGVRPVRNARPTPTRLDL